MNTPQTSLRRSTPARLLALLAFGFTLAALHPSGAHAAPPEGKGKGGGKGRDSAPGQDPNFIPPGHRRAPVKVTVKFAPPAVKVEKVPARISLKHVWVPGFWMWEGSTYVWHASAWMLPPEPKAVWVEPRYETQTGVSIMITGYWKL